MTYWIVNLIAEEIVEEQYRVLHILGHIDDIHLLEAQRTAVVQPVPPFAKEELIEATHTIRVAALQIDDLTDARYGGVVVLQRNDLHGH